tara:strand:+ start:204 stop:842 length:639 start_codon:yes stop_codon:yes gene_type:complete
LSNYIVSIDGPAGSGKERISKYIAKKYNFFHLDSGILYRRFAKIILDKKINIKKVKDLKILIKSINYLSPRNHKSLRKENISKLSSIIASKLIIRKFINQQQKKIIKKALKSYKGAVIDGRDIGSKVFKKANIKLFVKVSAEIRAKRRHKQLLQLGEKSIYAHILRGIKLRDYNDKNRKESPLVMPRKAILIDNSGSFSQTIKIINKVLKKI